MKLKRDITIRNSFEKNELFKYFLKKLEIKKALTKSFFNIKVINKQTSRRLNLTRYRNRCNFSKKPRSILRDFKSSGYTFKEKAGSLKLNGLKRASW